jgi:anaerobic magnesium-protoporphyrin IX monomethyl ester cyclase
VKIALLRNHDACINSRQIRMMQKRAGVLPHLGLGYIETSLRNQGFEVATIDAQAEYLDRDQLRARLREYGPDLVGVTTTTPGMPGALEACEVAKEVGAKVILGGPHTEVFDVENLYHDSIDYVGVGEGASIMPDLAHALKNKSRVEDIRGLVGRGFKNAAAPMLNLEDMGWPSRDSVPVENYFSIMAKRPFATMISSRGCPFQCSFCFKQAVDKKSIYRSAEDVVGEMEHLVRQYGIREIMFYDDVFTMKRKRVVEICDLIKSKGLKVRWEAPTRVDLVDDDLMRQMASAGCIRLRFGIESGDADILAHMQKKTNLDEIAKAVHSAKRAGIQTFGYFIVGWLDESAGQFERTVDFARQLPLDYASFYTATPLPGTKLHRDAIAAGKIDADYWLNYIRGDVQNRIGTLAENAEERSRIAYRGFYLRPKKIPILAKHLMQPSTFSSVMSGIAGLLRSDTNAVRDM